MKVKHDRPDIDGLRAIAVLSVVFFHAGFSRFSGGFLGVDIFFVISGFLITRIIRREINDGSFAFGRFYLRRARRLFPALFATLLLSFLAAVILLAPDLLREFSKSAIATIFWVSNVYFWTDSGYFDTASALKPLLHTWSLAVEEQFYLIWPVLMLAIVPARKGWTAPALLTAVALASMIGGIAIADHSSALFYLMPFRVFEFAAGALMVWILEWRRPSGAESEAALLAGFGLIACSIFSLSDKTPFPINGIIPSVGAALVIYAGQARFSGIALRNPIAVWIGQISYSIYLAHWPLIVFYHYHVNRALTAQQSWDLVGASILGGALMFRFVETPFRYQKINSLSPRRFGFACLAVALCATAVSASAYSSNGWPWRLGDRESLYLQNKTLSAAADYGGAACTPPRCENGGSGSPIIVIGDSHARAYFAGMKAAFPDRDLVFYEYAGCQFYSMEYTRNYYSRTSYDQPCRDVRKQAFEEIRKRHATVMIAENWGPMGLYSVETGASMTFDRPADFASFVGKSLREMKTRLAIPALYVIGDVPTMGEAGAPLDCLSRPIEPPSGCKSTPTSEPVIQKRIEFNTLLREQVADFAEWIDPMSVLCSAEQCANFKEGKAIYSDDNHLSKWGSKYVVKRLFASSAFETIAAR